MKTIHQAAIYDKRQTKEFLEVLNFQINRLMESVAVLIRKIKGTAPTEDAIAQQNGTGVSKKQKEEDFRQAAKLADSLITMYKTTLVDKADAETAMATNTKYKFDLKSAPTLASDLKNAYDVIMRIAPRKKAYQASAIWDAKNALNVDRRLFNLKILLDSYLDGNDKEMLSVIKQIKSDLIFKLVCLADILDKSGLYIEANSIDLLRKKLILRL